MRDDAGIDCLPGAGDDLKVELASSDLGHHEAQVSIETFRHTFRGPDIAYPQLAGVAEDEFMNSLVGYESFIKVFMSGKDYLNSVFSQSGFNLLAQIFRNCCGSLARDFCLGFHW